MFENILGQPVINLLASDIAGGVLAPSMLFSGPPASGKGSAALELGRILSCENSGAPWNCSCSACAHHRLLLHPDLLLLGPRPFSEETAASAAAFLRNPRIAGAKFLFIRSVRKLLARFSPVLWEDDPKISKLNPLIQSLEEGLEELDLTAAANSDTAGEGDPDPEALKKAVDSVLKDAYKLEAEGMGELIPVAQIRRAAYWSRLAPQGKRKLLVIENADRMQDGARNSLLKILEEPPETVSIVLTTAHHGGLLPTILSRLRPYSFTRRDSDTELKVIRQVFRDGAFTPAGKEGLIQTYLESFLPVSGETLYPLAALFTASVARGAALLLKRSGAPLSEAIVALGKYSAPIAEAAGLGRPREDTGGLVVAIMAGADNFGIRSQFSRFLALLLGVSGESLKGLPPEGGSIACREIWRKAVQEAEIALGTNLSVPLILDQLATELRKAMANYGSPLFT
ncbi:DNA polymerase III domain protein [Treponema primitia ZAS-2]|uniref:DNA polymerase III domain protein n=1 Tax=Treponema primitia (strain ATCC BAA-887 / DSM 12427 / ZAS-2) TaxID=545694 RepID=F5YII0_TREPZ|nr:DNA polymerase III [Treponema primitia]AEF85074.1 DNA polymerase III domain protein [Treponema primitia ZAS-2]